MKLTTPTIAALLVSAATARFVEQYEGNKVQLYPYGFYEESTEKYLIELSPGNTRWVTEDEKWALRRVSRSLPAGIMSQRNALTNSSAGWPTLHGHHRD